MCWRPGPQVLPQEVVGPWRGELLYKKVGRCGCPSERRLWDPAPPSFFDSWQLWDEQLCSAIRLLTNPRIVVPTGYGLKALKPWTSIAYSMKMVGVAGAFWWWKANWLFREEDALCAYDLTPLPGNQVLLCNADQSFLKLNTGFSVIVHLDRGTDAHFSQHGQQSLHPEFSPRCGQIFYVFLSCVLQNCLKDMC